MEIGHQLFDTPFGATIAQRLMAGNFNINSLRTNSLLRKDEWELLDSVIVQNARPRLRAVGDLLSRGLRQSLDGMRVTVLQWQTQSRTLGDNVSVSMDPQVEGRSERVRFDLESLPLPFFHADYQIGIRDLNVSRNGGQPLDTIMAAQKSADIAEKVEDCYINGLGGFSYGGGNIWGLTDHPQRKTATLGTSWTDLSVTGADIVNQVLELKQSLIDSRKYGPYALYIPTSYETKMDEDFKADGDSTIRERILAIDSIQSVTVLDKLPSDNVVLVQLTGDCVQMVEGLPLTNLQWETRGGMTQHFKIATIMVPRFFVDQDGNIGVAHLA
jgi:hypothetical protein